MRYRTLSLGLALTLLAGLPATTAAQQRPNVVLMLVDNLGFGDLSVYNGGVRGGMVTPNIDRLASEGMRFTQFLVEPGCTPSRAGLMTGQYSIRNGMSLVIVPGLSGGLDPDDYTLGKVFKDAGYNTAYVGKWHLGPLAQSQPQNQGFDRWLLGFKGTSDQVVYRETLTESGVIPPEMIDQMTPKLLEADGPGEPREIGEYTPEYKLTIDGTIADRAVDYIRSSAGQADPFFLMIGFTRPHFPNDPSDEFKGVTGAGKYGDSVVELDARTGEVLDAIRDAGIEDETMVVWLSDNGATVTATTLDEVHAGDNGPFRGELGDAYEGSIRTAGMIKWPGVIEPSVSNEMISVHDFLPTFASMLGVDLPTNRYFDGVDQLAFLRGQQSTSNRTSLITFIGDRIAGVRWNQFRIYPMKVQHTHNNPSLGGYMGLVTETAGFPQVFNITADPKERVDIAASGGGWVMGFYSRVVAEYMATLEQHPNPPAPDMTKFNSR